MLCVVKEGAPALKISNLTKTYSGVPVVKNLSLEIQPGEIVGLLGPNGAGKSTTINIVSGVARLESGEVQVFGWDNQVDFRQTRRQIGVMHQEIVIDPFFHIGQALKIHPGYYGVKDHPRWRELLIEKLDLGPHLHKSMNKLSGGMKRRFMVAKALIHKPKLLILDEPTAGVDVGLRHALWQFVREINAEGTTVLLTTHYLEEAEQMCGRIAIMNQGELVAVDTTRNLMARVEKKRLAVDFREPVTVLPDKLASFHPDLGNQGRRLTLRLSEEADIGEILHSLYGAGATIADVQIVTSSLEDVFLKLTGNGRPK